MHRGYIKLYRKIENWGWAKDIKTFRLFIQLLLDANRHPTNWRGVEVNTGETVTSVGALASETGLTMKEVRTALNHLKKSGEITVKTTQFYTLISVVNYGFYQGFEHFEQQSGGEEKAN